MQIKKSLHDSVENILRNFPNLVMEAPETGTVRIRGNGKGQFTDELVGVYTQEAFQEGEITEDDIRDDCEAFLRD